MLRLIPPGKRKGNRHYVARGRVNGRPVEFTTGTTDKVVAERVAARALAELVDRPAAPAAAYTFRQAAEAYTTWRSPSWRDVGIINTLTAEIGHLPLELVKPADLVALADRLYPTHKASSKNRLVMAPAAAILHYAADQEWVTYRRVRKFKEPAPVTRAVTHEDAQALIQAAEPDLAVLLLFLFYQGMRITDALDLTWDRVDLKAGVIEVHIAKTDQYRRKALHLSVRTALAARAATLGERKPDGRVFAYPNRWAVYRALVPLAASLGIAFTPHMARHSLGKWLNGSGAGLRTIMDALDHSDPKSSMRYQSTDVDGQRRALAKVGKNVGKAKKTS